jgi:hypothetical protein
MQNINIDLKGKKLVISATIDENLGRSGTEENPGKNFLVAKTGKAATVGSLTVQATLGFEPGTPFAKAMDLPEVKRAAFFKKLQGEAEARNADIEIKGNLLTFTVPDVTKIVKRSTSDKSDIVADTRGWMKNIAGIDGLGGNILVYKK